MRIAVITGASSGMGREFVRAIDKAYELDEIWVIARREDRLRALEGQGRAAILPLAGDLTDPAFFDTYQDMLRQAEPDVRVLVNASGYGKFEPHDKVDLKDAMGIIDLNCKALITMTHLTLPYMKAGSQIFNMGSLSAFQPVPLMLNYASSKALVLSYSRGLNVELAPKGIRVLCVCPGWVETEFFDRAQSKDKESVNYFNRTYKPQDVVAKALRDMQKGKDVSILGFPVRSQVFFVKLLPHKMVMRTWMKQQTKGRL